MSICMSIYPNLKASSSLGPILTQILHEQPKSKQNSPGFGLKYPIASLYDQDSGFWDLDSGLWDPDSEPYESDTGLKSQILACNTQILKSINQILPQNDQLPTSPRSWPHRVRLTRTDLSLYDPHVGL